MFSLRQATRFLPHLIFAASSLGGLTHGSQAHAQQFLVGAYLFAADASGATTSVLYQYDTNSSSSASPLNVNGASKGISFALVNGSNTFTFDQTLNTPLSNPGGAYGDLGLYFSSSNTPYNPAVPARTPDLLVARNTNGSTAFFTPNAGTSINQYFYSGQSFANGANSVSVGGAAISVTAYSVVDKPSGSFTLRVGAASTPEPGTLALLTGLGICGRVCTLRRRRSRQA